MGSGLSGLSGLTKTWTLWAPSPAQCWSQFVATIGYLTLPYTLPHNVNGHWERFSIAHNTCGLDWNWRWRSGLGLGLFADKSCVRWIQVLRLPSYKVMPAWKNRLLWSHTKPSPPPKIWIQGYGVLSSSRSPQEKFRIQDSIFHIQYSRFKIQEGASRRSPQGFKESPYRPSPACSRLENDTTASKRPSVPLRCCAWNMNASGVVISIAV